MVNTPETQAERLILSACMNYNHAIETAAEHLQPRHFANESHRTIYKACCELNSENEKVNLISLRNLLNQKHGDRFEMELVEIFPLSDSSANIQSHALILKQAYVRDQSMMILRDLPGQLSGFEIFAEVQKRMSQLENEVAITRAVKTVFDGDRLEERFNELQQDQPTTQKVYESGISDLDRVIGGFQTGTVTALQGLFKSGKTKLLLQILCRQALSGTPVGLLSLEMPTVRVEDWIMSHIAGIDSYFFKSAYAPQWAADKQKLLEKLAHKAGQLKPLPLYIDDIRRPTVDQVGAIVSQWARMGVRVVGLDYFERMRTGDDWKSEGAVTSQLADIAARHDISLIYIDQLNKTAEHDTKPSLEHSRGSVSRCADADMLIQLRNGSRGDKGDELPDHIADIELLIISREGVSGRRVKLRADMSIGHFAGVEEHHVSH